MQPAPEVAPHLISRCAVRVRFCETDLMGIVHHANYLNYFEVGRVDWLHRRGVSYDAWVKQGVHLPVVEVRLQYRRPARFDDELTVETTCHPKKRATVLYTFRILRGEELLCEGETLLACVGDDMLPMRIPDSIAAILASPELESAPT